MSRWYVVRDEATQEYLQINRDGTDQWHKRVDRAVCFSWKSFTRNAWSRRVAKRPQLAVVAIDRLPDRQPRQRRHEQQQQASTEE